jgi:hypothetical protein
MAVVAGVQASLGLESAAFVSGLNNAANSMRGPDACSCQRFGPPLVMKITFTGGKAIEARLRELGSAVAGRLGVNATKAGARVIAAEARTRLPVRTGRLKKSIRILDDREVNLARRRGLGTPSSLGIGSSPWSIGKPGTGSTIGISA